MKVLIAPDCYTGTLTAVEAADAIADGWRRSDPDAVLDLAPMADGGPGFLDAMAAGTAGTTIPVVVRGPLGLPTPAHVFLAEDGTAYVESAQACGTSLLPPGELHPMEAGTTGVGELLVAALDAGATRGRRRHRGDGQHRRWRGSGEGRGRRVADGRPDRHRQRRRQPAPRRQRAAAVYGPQKGADAGQVVALEDRLRRWVGESGGGSLATAERRRGGRRTRLRAHAAGRAARVRCADGAGGPSAAGPRRRGRPAPHRGGVVRRDVPSGQGGQGCGRGSPSAADAPAWCWPGG